MPPRKNACSECPFRRNSAPGYLGSASHDPEGFLHPHWHGERKLPCHMEIDWEVSDLDKEIAVESANHCLGYLTLMRNACKLPRDAEAKKLLSSVDRNSSDFFSFPQEFYLHHKDPGK
ncbi:MAG: hypothetical protein V3R83_12295 [Gammaproteobacteria bacterium]